MTQKGNYIDRTEQISYTIPEDLLQNSLLKNIYDIDKHLMSLLDGRKKDTEMELPNDWYNNDEIWQEVDKICDEIQELVRNKKNVINIPDIWLKIYQRSILLLTIDDPDKNTFNEELRKVWIWKLGTYWWKLFEIISW